MWFNFAIEKLFLSFQSSLPSRIKQAKNVENMNINRSHYKSITLKRERETENIFYMKALINY